MASITGGVPLGGFISPTDTEDQYPVTNPLYGLGGLRTVSGITERNNISNLRREQGMIVFSVFDQKYFKLIGGTGNEHWEEFSFGSTGSQGFQGFQGFQGVQGKPGSGKYFYGPTAPESTEDGLTFGSKWFNTVLGAELTYLPDDGGAIWVMANVISATGPQGSQGSIGEVGPQGVQGNDGTSVRFGKYRRIWINFWNKSNFSK